MFKGTLLHDSDNAPITNNVLFLHFIPQSQLASKLLNANIMQATSYAVVGLKKWENQLELRKPEIQIPKVRDALQLQNEFCSSRSTNLLINSGH